METRVARLFVVKRRAATGPPSATLANRRAHNWKAERVVRDVGTVPIVGLAYLSKPTSNSIRKR